MLRKIDVQTNQSQYCIILLSNQRSCFYEIVAIGFRTFADSFLH